MADPSSRTAICALDACPVAAMVKRTARPPGSTCGKRWSCPGVGVVRTLTSPPQPARAAAPSSNQLVAKMIESSAPQLAPRPSPFTGVTLTGGPPLAATA